MDQLLTQFGLPGIVIAGQAVIMRMLWVRLNDVQDKRIAEAREALTVMQTWAAAAEAVADGQEALSKGFEALRATNERKGT